ncbi:MAG: T9SS type A sorting domain-containing protein [Sphingobacteriales bacterium]|nr:T9SS type A sorting domain-containing protein [Sphingobacteriales bacterium]
MAPIALCQNVSVTLSGGTASIVAGDVNNGSTDACGIANLAVTTTSFNCSNIGANPVVLTVTDNNGNSSTCAAAVTVVGTIPSAVISQSTMPQFCQGNQVILTATPSEPVTYAWETGQTTQSINVYATGTYNLNVTNGNGCTASASTYVNYNPVGFNAAYTIIGFEEVHLHGYNTVLNGGVGVTTAGEQAKIHENTMITGATTFVKAPVLDIKTGSVVTNQYTGVANFTIPSYFGNPYAGVTNVNVASGATVTLSDSIYKNIQIGANAVVTFTRPIIYMDELKVKDGATVKFSGCAKISVNKKVDFEKNTKFNLERNKVTIYVGDEDKKDDKKVVEWGEGSVFFGNVFAQRGEIRSLKGKATNPIRLTGQFIGRKVQGDDYTIWDWETNCDPNCTPAPAPVCACVGGLKKITFEYSIWDSSSVSTNATMYIFSDPLLTDTLAKFSNVNPGDIFTVSATSLPGGIFNSITYAQIAQNPDSIIVIPTTCNADIVGSFYRELYMYSQVDNSNVLCGISSCANGKTLMCHKPKNKAAHTHCVKDKDVQKKLNSKGGEWSVGPCANNREIEADIAEELHEHAEVEMTAMPNPFFDITNIKLRLPVDARVRLAVYNAVGQEVELLYSGTVEGGLDYIYQFNGAGHAAGMYFYRLETSEGKYYVKPVILSK